MSLWPFRETKTCWRNQLQFIKCQFMKTNSSSLPSPFCHYRPYKGDEYETEGRKEGKNGDFNQIHLVELLKVYARYLVGHRYAEVFQYLNSVLSAL